MKRKKTVQRAPEAGPEATSAAFAIDVVTLAETLGNVSEACRRLGIDRSTYYRALSRSRRKRNGEEEGRSLLAKPIALERKLLGLCLEFPDWGCDKLALYLTLTGDPVSSPTVQKILIRHGLGRASMRRLRATESAASPRPVSESEP